MLLSMGTLAASVRLNGVAFTFRSRLWFRVAVVVLGCAALVAKAQSRFSETLNPPDWAAAGLAHLSVDQMAVLDALVQRDIAAARQGDVVAFARSFTERRTVDEAKAAGLDRLNDAERARLNATIADVIAHRPAVAFVPYIAPKGTAREVKTAPRPWEVHGEVSMFVGGGSGGRSWYGGSFDTWATDPSHHVTVGVGYSEVHGKGLRGCDRDPIW
jgi:hypothetical protein